MIVQFKQFCVSLFVVITVRKRRHKWRVFLHKFARKMVSTVES